MQPVLSEASPGRDGANSSVCDGQAGTKQEEISRRLGDARRPTRLLCTDRFLRLLPQNYTSLSVRNAAILSTDMDSRSSTPVSRPPRLPILDAIRGFAALAVCLYHLIGQIDLGSEFITRHSVWGALGVHAFFVVSGFVIPLSLYTSGYNFSNFGRFLIKRITRIDPPYLASIALMLAFGWAMATFVKSTNGKMPLDSLPQLLAHLGYANAILGYEWISPIYWTLAIEFQYYILIGLAFPLILHRSWTVRLAVLASLILAPYSVPDQRLAFYYLPWFAMGIISFYLRIGAIPRWAHLVLVGVFSAASFASTGPVETVALAGTTLLIAYWKWNVWSWITALGAISYSLYLTHGVFGRGFITVAKAFHPSPLASALVLILATAFSILCAFAFYRLVELPSIQLASKLRYGSKSGKSIS